MAKILVTGATGFIGKRLILELLRKGHTVYALVRIKGTLIFTEKKEGLELLWGDLRNEDALKECPEDIDAAYFLVHSMSDISKGLLETERVVANNFVKALSKTQAKQIIYLGGIVSDERLSQHLASRLQVETLLQQSKIPLTTLRASIIIGQGSASFEIIRDLVNKLPCMVAPKWINSLCQPIAVTDVIYYLTHVLLEPKCYGKTFDIGGPDTLSFKEVLYRFAAISNLRRWIFTVPVLTPRLSSYWLAFVTSVKFSLARYLVESMKTNSVCHNAEIRALIPHTCQSYDEAVKEALFSEKKQASPSTWMDSWEVTSEEPNIETYRSLPSENILQDERRVEIVGDVADTLQRIWTVGGRRGWYGYEWAWNLRGLIDKLFGGVGMNRGRRDPNEIIVGDSIDFWRVVTADKNEKHLVLFAEMKVPGKAWLEFAIRQLPGKDTPRFELVQRATFLPKGIIGKIYWYLLIPMHHVIFGNMARKIANG